MCGWWFVWIPPRRAEGKGHTRQRGLSRPYELPLIGWTTGSSSNASTVNTWNLWCFLPPRSFLLTWAEVLPPIWKTGIFRGKKKDIWTYYEITCVYQTVWWDRTCVTCPVTGCTHTTWGKQLPFVMMCHTGISVAVGWWGTLSCVYHRLMKRVI